MATIRDKLRKILENDLVLEFKDHHSLDNLDSFGATIKILEQKIENVIDLIMLIFEEHKNQ